ncbi:unnamed protein product (macronuclear) [Paramecium tetraurelia]|uniref:Transmembrane protein n=1 Tax=Paramecium tetraurelia TaxID=5888 RepID=A0E2X1_PARTE|nr:uncharacterized protein GSPATT00022810001 [Paramecium tetraurelia]CAK89638.1 unnamed protein product [Paramecium tetraurelia]|eukprot:XP_001457035.1 hypothetical protein (macronuclear) [Paramecium tetraurelia strain d4-2]
MLIILQLLVYQIYSESIYSESIQILTKQEAILDVFSSSEVILEQHLNDQKLCQIVPQQLVAHDIDDNSITLIDSYKDEIFSQNFEIGSFIGSIGRIIRFVQITNGVLVLLDDAELKYLSYRNNSFQVKSSFKIEIEKFALEGKVFLEYFYYQQQVLLIANTQTIALDLIYDDDDLYIKQYRIYEQWQISHINSIATVGNIMIVAMDTGIKMFELKDHMLNEILIAIDQINRVSDIKIFNQKNNEIYYIYLLDKIQGINQYIFNTVTQELQRNLNLGIIPYPGEILDIHGDILMVVKDYNLFEIHVDYYLSQFTLFKQHQLETEIVDIELTEQFAIVIGRNGHQIVFHSIPPIYSQFEWMNQLVIPNLKQLSILSFNKDTQLKEAISKNIIIGITQHKFFYSKVQLEQSFIQCYSDEATSKIELHYTHKATRCKTNLKKKECNLDKSYQIQFVEPKEFGGNKQTYFLIVLLYLAILLLFILFIASLIYLYKKYHVEPQPKFHQKIPETTAQNLGTDHPNNYQLATQNKFVPHSRDDQTPISEQRDQMNQKLHNNRPVTQENCDQSPGPFEIG